MSETPLRVLQIGLGNRGMMWTQIIDAHPNATLCGVMDIDPARVAAFAETHPGVPAFSTLPEALAAGSAEMVLLVTPPAGHLEQARAIFAGGLPLLAEKPLTLDLGEAVEIVALARAAKTPLAVGLNFRYLSVSQKIRQLIQQKVVGEPGFAQFIYQRNRDGLRPGLNKYPLTMLHPMMLEQSIHHLDLLRFCYDREVVAVSCRTWNPPWSMYAHDSNVHCLLTLAGGMEVNYLGTWTGGWNELQFQWRTDCDGGVIVQRQLFADLALARTGDPELTPVPITPCEPFLDDSGQLLSSFIAHLRTGAPLECSGADHLITLALCFAAIESSATGQTIPMAPFCARHGIEFPA